MNFQLFYRIDDAETVPFSTWSALLTDAASGERVHFTIERDELETVSESHLVKDLDESPDDALLMLVDLAGRDHFDADTVYTQGDCEVFAVALQEIIPGSSLVAVYDPVNPETGRKTRGAPYLIHAGVRDGDTVYDIRGASEVYSWVSVWMENGNASELSRWGAVDVKELERMQKQKVTPLELEIAKPFADLVSSLYLGVEPSHMLVTGPRGGAIGGTKLNISP